MNLYDDITLFGLTEANHLAPIADHDVIAQIAGDALTAILDGLAEAGLERYAPAIGWGVVNAVHREIDRTERTLDENASVIRELAETQDGSEVRDVELQDAMAAQNRLDEDREALETFREAAAGAYATVTGEPWLPRKGSRTGRGVTAAQIDARAMLKAQREQRAAALSPEGPRFIVTGPPKWADAEIVMRRLDKLHTRKPDMVLVTRGGPGVELIARKWAALRNVASITVAMDWSLGKQAAFRAVDEALALKPEGVVTFETAAHPANGLQLNLLQKAAAKRIATWRIGHKPARERAA